MECSRLTFARHSAPAVSPPLHPPPFSCVVDAGDIGPSEKGVGGVGGGPAQERAAKRRAGKDFFESPRHNKTALGGRRGAVEALPPVTTARYPHPVLA